MHSNKRFLDPEAVLFRTGVSRGNYVVDLGAGSGFFALASAEIVGSEGQVLVVDILESALEHVSAEARLKNLRNIKTVRADLETDGVEQIEAGSADVVIIANLIYQIKDPSNLMRTAYRLLKTNGKLLVIDWNAKSTSIGPKTSERISEEQIKAIAEKMSLKFNANIEADQYHFGLIFVK